ncbi:TPA: RnfABCDGE type electron transport complex subunit D [Salmonella enterica subsp. enterica serovar Wangata]|nr:RnfABCDGE type electron transport complex subunit D [Salmonella enterica subsp. enterica serovar Wangata]HAU7807469.1 RnfABCDGE type electron transport complex subunit D [Salmonella enterica subsp. enterica serovar Wangata]
MKHLHLPILRNNKNKAGSPALFIQNKMTTYNKFIACLMPVIISGLFNQYLYVFNEDLVAFVFSIFILIAAISSSAFVSIWLVKMFFGYDIRKSVFYSSLIFFCIVPAEKSFLLIIISYFIGCMISLARITIKRHTFYLNPAVAGRLAIFLYSPPYLKSDGITSATPLTVCRNMLTANYPCHSFSKLFLITGQWAGTVGETSKAALLISAILLVYFKLHRIGYMVASITGAYIAWLTLSKIYNSVIFDFFDDYVLMGSLIFGCLFMTHDIFTSGLDEREHYIYYLSVGFLCFLIRLASPFPEGTLLSIICTQFLFLIFYTCAYFKGKTT